MNKIKKNDQVLVLAGKDKGKKEKVLAVNYKAKKVLVDNVMIVKRHTKKTQKASAGIISRPAFFSLSNVMVVCPSCSVATRVAIKEIEGNKSRYCKKCNKVID